MFPQVIKSHHHRPHPLGEEEKGLGNMPMREGRRGEQMGNREEEGQGDTVLYYTLCVLSEHSTHLCM